MKSSQNKGRRKSLPARTPPKLEVTCEEAPKRVKTQRKRGGGSGRGQVKERNRSLAKCPAERKQESHSLSLFYRHYRHGLLSFSLFTG